MTKPLVIIESPYAVIPGERTRSQNLIYARDALMDSLQRGEAPFASHLLYTQVLNDDAANERLWGIEAGFAWASTAKISAVYADHGITPGMRKGIANARRMGLEIHLRFLQPIIDTERMHDIETTLREP